MFYATGSSGTIGRHLPSKFQSIDVDLGSPKSINSIVFERGSRLIHLAGIVGAEQVKNNLELANRVNVGGSVMLAQKFLESDGDLFIYVSSSHVYKSSEDLIGEDFPINPLSLYAEQKVAVEMSLQEMFSNYMNKLSIVRVFSILDWNVNQFTLGGAVRKIREQQSDISIKNSDDIRDFTTPLKTAMALAKIAEVRVSGITNLCTGIGQSISSALTTMLRLSNYEVPQGVLISGHSDIPQLVGNPSRLLRKVPQINLDWNPKLTIDQKC